MLKGNKPFSETMQCLYFHNVPDVAFSFQRSRNVGVGQTAIKRIKLQLDAEALDARAVEMTDGEFLEIWGEDGGEDDRITIVEQ